MIYAPGIPLEESGALPVVVQDQHSRAFDLYFHQDIGGTTTLVSNAVVDDYSIEVTTGHGLIAGNDFILRDVATQSGYTGHVVLVVGSNTVNLDRAVDRAFSYATTIVQKVSYDLDVNGAVTRQIFHVGGGALTAELDVTRFIFQITTTDPPDFDEFGDRVALTRGITMRVVNSRTDNLWNMKKNSDFANLMYDLTVYEATKSFNVNGLAGRMTYAGQNKHGVTLRIGANEWIELIVQDDLTSLLSFRMIACGHIVTD